MGQYLFEVAYSGDSWSTQVREKGNVLDRIQPIIAATGGRVDSCFYTFGERDLILIGDFPSAEDAAAFSMACSAGGSVKSIRTTTLLTVEQGLDAMRRAEEAGKNYHPPVDTGAAHRV